MFQMIAGFIGSWIPGIGKVLVDGYKAKLDSENNIEHTRADLAARELDVQKRELELQTQLRLAQIGKWYEPEHLCGYIIVTYLGKCVVWDKVLGLGSTDALSGDIQTWAGLIILFYFGKRGFENVARILARK